MAAKSGGGGKNAERGEATAAGGGEESFPAGSISAPEDGVVAMLEDFYYFEDPLTDRVEAWATAQPRAVLDSFAREEHDLVQTRLHAEYTALFERVLTEYLEKRGFTARQFYEAAAQQEEASIAAGRRRRPGDTFSSVITAASDFDEFCVMMNMVRQGHGVAFCPPLMSASEGESSEGESSEGGERESSTSGEEEGGGPEGKTAGGASSFSVASSSSSGSGRIRGGRSGGRK
mgnify:CR=1 FL=1